MTDVEPPVCAGLLLVSPSMMFPGIRSWDFSEILNKYPKNYLKMSDPSRFLKKNLKRSILGHFSPKMAQNGQKMRFFEDCQKSSHRISMKLGMKLGHYKVHLWAVVVILGKICKLVIFGLFVPKKPKNSKNSSFPKTCFSIFLENWYGDEH